MLKIKPYFGNKTLNSISQLELEEWQNILLKKYASRSVVKYRSVFYCSLFFSSVFYKDNEKTAVVVQKNKKP